MKIEFTATEIGCFEEYGVISCGASNTESNEEYHYINLQRDIELTKDDNGIYFEIDDQGNCDYNKIHKCSINKNKMVIEMAKDYEAFPALKITVHFNEFNSEGLEPINIGLKTIFQKFESKLNA